MYDFMLVFSVVFFVVLTVIYVRHPACSVYHPATAYLIYHLVVFVVRPIFARVYNFDMIYNAIGFRPSVSDKITVLIGTNLALFSFLATLAVIAKEPLVFKQFPREVDRRRELLKYFWPVALPLGILGAYSLYWQWGIESSSELLGEVDLRSGFRAMEATNGYFLAAGSMLAILVVLYAYLHRFKLLSLLPFIGFATLRLGTGGRGDFITGSAMLAVLFLYDKRRHWPEWRSLAGAIVAVALFSTVVSDRGAAVRELFGIEGVNQNRVGAERFHKPFEQMDFANLEAFEYMVYVVPQRSGTYDYFLNNLRVLTEPIPRALWKNKPLGEPFRRFYLYDYGNFIALASSVPAIGWYSMGYLGIVIWSAFFAWMYGAAYKRFVRSRQSNLALLSYSILLSTAILAFRDGALITVVKLSFYSFTPLLLIFGLVWMFRPSLLRSGPPVVTRAAASAAPRTELRAYRRRAGDGHVVPRARRTSPLDAT
jgi:oligosaccharide repeat unit polymerase